MSVTRSSIFFPKEKGDGDNLTYGKFILLIIISVFLNKRADNSYLQNVIQEILGKILEVSIFGINYQRIKIS